MGVFPPHLRDVPAGRGSGSLVERRIALAAAATVADLLDGWGTTTRATTSGSAVGAGLIATWGRQPAHGPPAGARSGPQRPAGRCLGNLATRHPADAERRPRRPPGRGRVSCAVTIGNYTDTDTVSR